MKAFLIVSAVGVAIGLSVPAMRAAPRVPQPVQQSIVFTPQTRAPGAVQTSLPAASSMVLQRSASGHFVATGAVNGAPVDFVVDTGADTVALTIDDARNAHVAVDPAQFTVVGRGAGGPVRGQLVTLGSVELGGKRATELRGVVLEGLTTSLLGQNYLRQFDLRVRNDAMELR